MDKEIRRNDWSRFCKKFNADNQYRPTKISVKRRSQGATDMEMSPFMGIALSKKGRFIDGVRFYTGRWNPENIAEPIMTITDPASMKIEKDKTGRDVRLRIRGKDGTEAMLELMGDKNDDQMRGFVEKIAYAMYERRGYMPGNDWDDWFEAEHKVHEAETQLIK
jgi:hypothetical protein